MIMPTKHISPQRSLLGVGALVLGQLARPKTVSTLWEQVKALPEVGSFERFVLTLDFLYSIGAISLQDGLLRRGD
jgi:hypothetical protein